MGNIVCKVIKGILPYELHFCTLYDCIFDKDQTYEKNGFKESDILLLDICGYGLHFEIKETKIFVNMECFISTSIKYVITLDLKNKISKKDITKKFRTSHNNVKRIIDFYYDSKKLYKHYLPEVLSSDEFKSVKFASDTMSFKKQEVQLNQ